MKIELFLVRVGDPKRLIGEAGDMDHALAWARRRLLQRDIYPDHEVAIHVDGQATPWEVVRQTPRTPYVPSHKAG